MWQVIKERTVKNFIWVRWNVTSSVMFDEKYSLGKSPSAVLCPVCKLEVKVNEGTEYTMLSISNVFQSEEFQIGSLHDHPLHSSNNKIPVDELIRLIDNIPEENGMLLDVSIKVSKVTKSDSLYGSFKSILESGDRSILEKLKPYLEPDSYDKFCKYVDTCYQIKYPNENDMRTYMVNSLDKLIKVSENQLSMCTIPICDRIIRYEDYNAYQGYLRELNNYIFTTELLQSIILSSKSIKATFNLGFNSPAKLINDVVSERLIDIIPTIRERWSGIISDANIIYINPDFDYDINEIMKTLKFASNIHTRQKEIEHDAFGMTEDIPCTTSQTLHDTVISLMKMMFSFKTKDYFSNINLVKEFKAAVKLKLEKHKAPTIDMSKCSIDNISVFVDSRFKRIKVLELILTCCDRYIELYNTYKDKEYIPMYIALDVFSVMHNYYNEISVILAKVAKYAGDGNMYKGLNTILKISESYTVEPENINREISWSYQGSWNYGLDVRDPNYEKNLDIMKTGVSLRYLGTVVCSSEISKIIESMVFRKEFLNDLSNSIDKL